MANVKFQKVEARGMNRRRKILLIIVSGVLVLAGVCLWGLMMEPALYAPNYEARRLAPSLSHLFGTDNLGRDMFYRTVCGLSTSIQIGLLSALISSVIALLLGSLSAIFGGKVDQVVSFMVDLCMGVPHLILLILISIAVGGGAAGVITGVAVTHWPNLTRVIRAEVMQIRSAQYVQIARKLGKSNWHIAAKHIVPHVFPQYLVGLILLFPHAILHEAAITFLGYGLPLDTPAVGVILAESMKHLATGMWWLAFFPGIALLLMTQLFDIVGDYLKILIDPHSARK
ncbi:MAG: ABC transporter permease [Acidaminococcaceae bacterium]|nr:ABC transporter permease [Acidaminococcaceae bacterium]MBQ8491700.1 ABC transporter permease [Acidaminococcaceae bacterium]MBQ9256675.1 ABC transporter permease [Acidaminococcaceae bacterium]MBQ9319461.1 ABC transporter permease [Acidaminococcaceae bacterium]